MAAPREGERRVPPDMQAGGPASDQPAGSAALCGDADPCGWGRPACDQGDAAAWRHSADV